MRNAVLISCLGILVLFQSFGGTATARPVTSFHEDFGTTAFRDNDWTEVIWDTAAGEIRLPDGTVTAECEALLAPPPNEFMVRWESEKPYWRVYE